MNKSWTDQSMKWTIGKMSESNAYRWPNHCVSHRLSRHIENWVRVRCVHLNTILTGPHYILILSIYEQLEVEALNWIPLNPLRIQSRNPFFQQKKMENSFFYGNINFKLMVWKTQRSWNINEKTKFQIISFSIWLWNWPSTMACRPNQHEIKKEERWREFVFHCQWLHTCSPLPFFPFILLTLFIFMTDRRTVFAAKRN